MSKRSLKMLVVAIPVLVLQTRPGEWLTAKGTLFFTSLSHEVNLPINLPTLETGLYSYGSVIRKWWGERSPRLVTCSMEYVTLVQLRSPLRGKRDTFIWATKWAECAFEMEEWCNFSSHALGERFFASSSSEPLPEVPHSGQAQRLSSCLCFPVFLRGQLQRGSTSVSYSAAIHSLIVHSLLPRGELQSFAVQYFDSFSEKGVTALPSRATKAENIKWPSPAWCLQKMEVKIVAWAHRFSSSMPQAAFQSTLHTTPVTLSRHPLSKWYAVSTARIQILLPLNPACWKMFAFDILLKTNFSCGSMFYYLKVFT